MLTYRQLTDLYGRHAVGSLKEYENCSRRLTKLKNRRIFLLRCKHEGVTPTFLSFNFSHVKFDSVNSRQRCNNFILPHFIRQLLNLLISDTTCTIKNLQKRLNDIEKTIETNLPSATCNLFKIQIRDKMEILFNRTKQTNQNKINKFLKCKKPNANEAKITNPNWTENLTECTIPDNVSKILSLGPNFAVENNNYKKIPTNDIICNIEVGMNHLTNQDKEQIRSKTCNILTNFTQKLKNQNNNKKSSQLSKNITQTQNFLKEHPELKVLKADKTNKTVIMNSADYDKKMMDILSDKKTYKQVKLNPTNTYQKLNNDLIKSWQEKDYISPSIAKTLTIHNALPPKIYGLPKLHKEGIPLRPIVSCIQSPFNALALFQKTILNHTAYQNKYYIKNSFDFKDKIKNVKVPSNYVLISLDVISLYTSIPNVLAIKSVEKRWDKISTLTDIPKNEFISAIDTTLHSTFFAYGDAFYKQIDGCAMGASISSIVAQIVMEDLEEKVISELPFKLPFFYRYVDDCITAVPQDKINDIVSSFNKYHKKLQFTVETELNGILNFLDLTLHRNNGNIKTEWFTKPTWSSRYLHFDSNHPLSQKKSVIIGLADRAIKLSDTEFIQKSIDKAKNALKINNYPPSLVNNIFKNRLEKNNNNPNNKTENKKTEQRFLKLPYIKGLSSQFQNLFLKHNITVCHKGHNLLSKNFSKLKTKTPKNKISNIVYEIPCNDCPGVYIGQTSQYLENRIKSHKYDKKNKTALTNHETTKKHTFNFENTKIIKSENITKKRELHEMLHIQKTKNAVNDKKDVTYLGKIYAGIIN